MTGFASYIRNGYFTGHADTLLSSRVGHDVTPILPTLPRWFDAPDSGEPSYIPVSMCQKIVIVSPQVCFLWAGGLSVAKQLYADIIRLSKDKGFLEKDAAHWIFEKYSSKNIEAVIYSIYAENQMSSFNIGCTIVDVDPFGAVLFGGSGQGSFFGIMSEFSYQKKPHLALESYDNGEVTKEFSDYAVFKNVIESVLQFRMLIGDFSNVHTGAGIDTVTIRDGHFYKPASTLFVIFSYAAPDFIGQAPCAIIKRSYHEGYLGFSLDDYALREGRSVTIGHPGNIDTPCYFTPDTHDPFNGTADAVHCIYIRENGAASHFSEDPLIFKEHFSFDYDKQLPIISDWYVKDTDIRRQKSI